MVNWDSAQRMYFGSNIFYRIEFWALKIQKTINGHSMYV